MSQRGPALPPAAASRPSSRSPPGTGESRTTTSSALSGSAPYDETKPLPPPELAIGEAGGGIHGGGRGEAGGVMAVVSNGDDRAHILAPRAAAVGLHSMLNPSDLRHGVSAAPVPHAQPTFESERDASSHLAVSGPPQQPFHYPSATRRPSLPPAASLSTLPSPTITGAYMDRRGSSPSSSQSIRGALGTTPRRPMLTPKSPRAASLSRSAALRSADTQPPPLPPLPPAARLGDSPREIPSPLARTPPVGQAAPFQPGSLPVATMLSSTVAGLATPGRSVSQPLYGHGLSASRPHDLSNEPAPSRDVGGRPTGFPLPASFSTQPGHPALPSVTSPSLGFAAEGGRWTHEGTGGMGLVHTGSSGGGGGGGVTRTFSVSEGGEPIMSLHLAPGKEITVPVDVHQASKQATEKRNRNAGASARFRARKKAKEAEDREEKQKLESRNRDLETRVHELEAERDFYRDDRNRLRNIVARTPEISQWADRGPSSPRTARGAPSSFPPEPSPHHGPPPPPLGLPQPSLVRPFTGGDQSGGSLERPTRRRRTTDPDPQFPAYAGASAVGPPPPPNSQPPPHYGATASHAPAAGAPARLPPLRFEQAGQSPTGETPPPMMAGCATSHLPPPPHQAHPSAGHHLPPPQQQQQQPPPPPYTRPHFEPRWATAPRPPPEGGSR